MSPALEWDGQNPARDEGEAALADVLAQSAAARHAAADVRRQHRVVLPAKRNGKMEANFYQLLAPIQKLHDEITIAVLNVGLVGISAVENLTSNSVYVSDIKP